jgi:HK97 family phage portal protein
VSLDQAGMISQNRNWAAICANFNGVSVAQVPLRVFAWNRGNRELRAYDHRRLEQKEIKYISKKRPIIQQNDSVVELFDHPLNYLLEKPSPYLDQFSLLELLTKYLDFTGNAYLHIEYKDGVPNELQIMNPALTQVVPGERKLIKGYIYGKNAPQWDPVSNKNIIAISPKDVVRFHVPSLISAYYGASVIEQHIGAISRNDLYDIYENSALKNNARPDFVVKYTKKLDPKTMKDLVLQWNGLYKGEENTNKVAVMDSEFDIEKLSFSPKDMEFLDGRRVTLKQIASAFGVPYALLDQENILKAGLDQILPLYQKYGIKPRLRRLENAINEQLCPKFDNSGRLFVAFDECVDEDRRFNLLQSKSLFEAGIIDKNEAREIAGFGAVEAVEEEQPLANVEE